MTGSQNRQGHAEYRETSICCGRRAELLEGFTIEQWGSYAKQKSCIATTTCTDKGRLKAELNSIFQQRNASDLPVKDANVDLSIDQVYSKDPWQNANIY